MGQVSPSAMDRSGLRALTKGPTTFAGGKIELGHSWPRGRPKRTTANGIPLDTFIKGIILVPCRRQTQARGILQ